MIYFNYLLKVDWDCTVVLQAVLGNINDTCIMIRIMIQKMYQVSRYIIIDVSASVSLIH